MKKIAYVEMFNAEDKHWWYVGLHDLVLLLSERMFPKSSLNILDAGCGTGGLLSILAATGHQVEGVDYSDDALAYCEQRGLSCVHQADINDWKPKPNSYDIIVSMDVLYHKWIHNEVHVLESFAAGLKDDGIIMLNYPAFPILHRKHDDIVMGRERYTKKIVEKRLRQAGLEPIINSYRLPHAFLYLLLLRIFDLNEKKNSNTESDVASIPPKPINRVLIQLAKFENKIIARNFSIPFGSSLFVVAKKCA